MITIDRVSQKGTNRYPFPTIDFKFQNQGNATAFLWQFGIEVLHVKIDPTPVLDCEADVENNALVLRAKNNGWGPAHNCCIQLEEPLLSLLYSEDARQYKGSIQSGESQEIYRFSKAVADAKQFQSVSERFENLSIDDRWQIKKHGLLLTTMDVSWSCNDAQHKGKLQVRPHHHVAKETWWDIILTEIGFEKVSYRDHRGYMLLPSDTTYGAIINPLKGTRERMYPVSRKIPSGDVDRFHIMIGSTMSCYLQIRFKFFIGRDIVVESEAFDIQVWNPRNPGWHLLYEKNTEYDPRRRGKYFADFDMIGNFYETDKTIDDISPLIIEDPSKERPSRLHK